VEANAKQQIEDKWLCSKTFFFVTDAAAK